ncbi:MAG TPA: tRNA (guanosine(46)-N7)-methyltransferase TrmB [Steroidobacteraceae bacterium]
MTDSADHTNASTRRRTIRSYVLRSGRATAAQQRALEQLWPKYGVPRQDAQLDFDAIFGRRAPRMLEIGFGAGEALLAFAQSHPEMDCIGIEVHRPGIGHLLLGVHAAQLTNVRVIDRDAVEVLQDEIPSASIAVAHIFFPDPWHKKRHHKRRLIQPPFVQLLARVLEPGATLRLATDWENYALQMREVLDSSNAFRNVAGEAGFVARSDVRPLTKFEKRGQRLGHRVWDLEYVRV